MKKTTKIDRIPLSPINKKTSVKQPKKVKASGKEYKVRKKLSEQDMVFLKHYALTNSKPESVRAAGLHLKMDGTEYDQPRHYEIANQILRNDQAIEIVRTYQQEILKSNVLSIEKVINETYAFYQMLVEEKKYHEANIAYNRLTDLLKLTNAGLTVNQQIVDNGGGITINYITPNNENKK